MKEENTLATTFQRDDLARILNPYWDKVFSKEEAALGPHATSSEELTHTAAGTASCPHHGTLRERAGLRTRAGHPMVKFGGCRHLRPHRLPHLSVLHV